MAFYCIALQKLHCIALHCIALHCIALYMFERRATIVISVAISIAMSYDAMLDSPVKSIFSVLMLPTRCSIDTHENDVTTAAIQQMSLDAGIVTSYIKQIPNQPIVLKVL